MHGYRLLTPLLLTALLAGLIAAPLAANRTPERISATRATIDPRLLASTSDKLTYFVILRQQADLRLTTLNWQQRGVAVYQRLTAVTSSQPTVAATLSHLQERGDVLAYRAYWLVNAFYVLGNRASIEAISRLPEVATLVPAGRQRLLARPQLASPTTSEWNIGMINAPAVWALGDRGAGITVADISSGALSSHPALSRQYRGSTILPGNDYNWFDPIAGSLAPHDDNGVGSHSLGVVLGEDASQTNQIGVAPAADWIACKAFDSSGYGTDPDILSCMQWMLAPTDLSGNNPRPDLRPNVVNNGWSAPDGSDQTYRGAVQAWLAAGILPFFAAGDTFNGQSSCTVAAPASYPESFALGAADSSDYLADFSCNGPSPIDQGYKPQAVAPAVNVRSSVPSGTCYLCNSSLYATYSSTGVAAAHASGVAALLLNRNPSLTPTQLTYILTSTTHFSSTWGVQPNNNYGWGRLDALAAYNATPAPGGLVTGRITSGGSAPIAGAVVSTASNPPYVNSTSASGYYTLSVAPASYALTARAYGYYSQTVPITVPNGVTITQNFDLNPAPSYNVHFSFNGPTGPTSGLLSVDDAPYLNLPVTNSLDLSLPVGSYLARFYPADRCYAYVTATLTVPAQQSASLTSPRRFDSAGYSCNDTYPYSWLPGATALNFANRDEGATTVNLPFPFTFYGQTYTTLNVTTNGNLQFGGSVDTSGLNQPIPRPAAPNNALYPFWDDLSLVNQGNVYVAVSGSAPNRRFAVEWRAVQHYDNAGPYGSYTFEAVLDEGSNNITFQYATMSGDDANGDSATIGIEDATGSVALPYSLNIVAVANSEAIHFNAPYYPPPSPTPTPTDCPNPFVDITGNIFYGAIHYLACRSVVNGTNASHFSPAATSTRGQFAKVVVLGFGLPLTTPAVPDFTDVPPSYFAYAYIESGYASGILSGFDATSCYNAGATFPCYLPNRAITRGQLTKLVVSAAHYAFYTPSGGQQTYTDVPPTNVFYPFIETAHQHGVINGYPNGTFLPNAAIRRDQMCQIVYAGVTNP